MPLSLQQIQHASAGLARIGVAKSDIVRLLDACDQDPELVLATVELPSVPREGDRIRVFLPPKFRTLLVEAAAVSTTVVPVMEPVDIRGLRSDRDACPREMLRYAVVGRPVDPSPADDTLIEKVVRAPERRTRAE